MVEVERHLKSCGFGSLYFGAVPCIHVPCKERDHGIKRLKVEALRSFPRLPPGALGQRRPRRQRCHPSYRSRTVAM